MPRHGPQRIALLRDAPVDEVGMEGADEVVSRSGHVGHARPRPAARDGSELVADDALEPTC
jgi:hypothetical protein